MERYSGSITDVVGVRVGCAQDDRALTGCTVVLTVDGAVAGGVVRGLAPGTREMALLRPGTLVNDVQAVLLTGGSAFGLSAADGVMRFLEERGYGFPTAAGLVPIVPAAVIYDLDVGDSCVRPNADMGYLACVRASASAPPEGNVGAGTGATVGKLLGIRLSTKSGQGTASLSVGALVVGALVVVNAFGDVIHPDTARILAGTRHPSGRGFLDTARALCRQDAGSGGWNTVIGVVATNARLDSARANLLAEAAHEGLARVVRPAHTLYDGDTFFALSLGKVDASFPVVSELAARAVAQAIANAVWAAEDAGGIPCLRSVLS